MENNESPRFIRISRAGIEEVGYEWAVYLWAEGMVDVIGTGNTCAEAVAEARATFRSWRAQ